MTLFTPALLVFVPLWTTACFLSLATPRTPLRGSASESNASAEPEHWVAMPFVPPTVHAA